MSSKDLSKLLDIANKKEQNIEIVIQVNNNNEMENTANILMSIENPSITI